MLASIAYAGLRKVFRIELCMAPDSPERGLTGSGLLIVNPPFTLPEAAAAALPWLGQTLGATGPLRADWLAGE